VWRLRRFHPELFNKEQGRNDDKWFSIMKRRWGSGKGEERRGGNLVFFEFFSRLRIRHTAAIRRERVRGGITGPQGSAGRLWSFLGSTTNVRIRYWSRPPAHPKPPTLGLIEWAAGPRIGSDFLERRYPAGRIAL